METEDIDKILSKPYSELSSAERDSIREICDSEEEFLQLQQFFASVEVYARETSDDNLPSPATKDRLDDLFHQTYQDKGILWYNSLWASLYPVEKRFDQRPLVRIAAVLVVLISIVPFLNGPESKKAVAVATKSTMTESKETVPFSQPETTAQTAKGLKQVAENPASVASVSPVLIAALDRNAEPAAIYYENASVKEISPTAFGSVSYNFSRSYAHPDGIYMDTFSLYYNDNFSVSQNLAVLDLLTPTF